MNGKLLSRVWVAIDGGLDWILDLLTTYTRLGTTSNYSATANLHNSQITTAPAKPFPSCCDFNRSLVTASNSGDSSATGLKSSLNGGSLPTEPLVKVKVTLRLAVYRESFRLGVKHLETHDQTFFFQLNSCGNSPYVTSSLTRRWVCLLWICLAFRQVYMSHT
jgi:hypothetical protein